MLGVGVARRDWNSDSFEGGGCGITANEDARKDERGERLVEETREGLSRKCESDEE